MTTNIEKNGTSMVAHIYGRVDTTTAPDLEKILDENITNIKDLTLDMTNLEYISSAGLRVILKEQKAMSKVGSMVLTNVSDAVMEVLTITGFVNILTIK